MTSETSDNPFQSPDGEKVAASWRTWRAWRLTSALLFAVAWLILWMRPWSGWMIFVGVVGVIVRSYFDLNRKAEADWVITWRTQLASLGGSMLIGLMGAIASFIAFFMTCTGMVFATNYDLFLHGPPAEASGHQIHTMIVLGTAFVAMFVAFGVVLWKMGLSSLESLRKANPNRSVPTAPVTEEVQDER